MTLEGHDRASDETPAPPARTRWQEDHPDEEDVLLPPFVPGRSVPRAGPAAAAPSPATTPMDEAEVAGSAPEAASSTREPEAAPDVESSPFDFPWEQGEAEAVEAEPEPAPDVQGGPDLDAPGVAGPEASAAAPAPFVADDEDEFPFDAFDIEGDDAPAPTPEAGIGAGPAAAAGTDTEALADRVESLAAVLRREGRAGVEREMTSRDRLTALVAGVLAGYLAGLED